MTEKEKDPREQYANWKAPDSNPDLTESDIQEIQTRLQPEKKVEQLSDQELAALGIKKSIGDSGEDIYDYGVSPDTGLQHIEMQFRVATHKKEMTDDEIAAQEVRAQADADDFKRRVERGEIRLPSNDD